MIVPRSQTNFIVVHCTATDPDWHGATTVEDIDSWHRARGWDGIGYHFYINRAGVLFTGRELHDRGAHVRGFNWESVGICMEGGVLAIQRPTLIDSVHYEAVNNFTEKQFLSLLTLTTTLKSVWPEAQVLGHRDFPEVYKSCPSFDVRSWWEEART